MAVQRVRPQTLLPVAAAQGGQIPGDAATGHLQREVDKFFRALEPRKTDFLNKVKKVSAAAQVKIEWGQKFYRPLSTTIAAQQSSGATTATLASGDGAIIQQYMVFRFIDSTAGDEIEWLAIAPPTSGDVVSGLKRAQGGTSAVTHASGTVVEIIGTAMPYGAVDHVLSPTTFGSLVYNSFQRFGGSIDLDRAAEAIKDWENGDGRKLAELVRMEAANQKYLLQKAVLYGGRQVADNTTTPRTPGLMGGWRQFVTTHVTDMTNLPISIWDVDDLAAEVWDDVTDNAATTLCMSNNTKRAFGRRVAPLRDLSGAANGANSVDFRLDKIMLDGVGEVSLMVIPEFPEREIWGVNFDMLELVPFEGLDWHFTDLPTAGEYKWEAVSGDFSLRVKGEASQFRLYNVNTDLNNYSKGLW